jgi:type II secretory pathway component PulC
MTPGTLLSYGFVSRHAIRAANLACVAGLSLLLASWTWTLLQPGLGQPDALPQAQAQTFNLAGVRSAPLFGGAAGTAGQGAPAVNLSVQFKLSGVVAALGRLPGFALIAVNGQPAKSFKLNDELSPGYRLASIYPRSVSIQTPNGLSELHFETDRAPGSGPGAATAAPTSGGVSRTIPRSLMQAAQNPATMRVLATSMRAAPGQGVQVLNVPAGSIIETLALLPGDLITQVNGRSMANPQALMALPQALLGNHVALVVRRNGVPQTFQYSIQ